MFERLRVCNEDLKHLWHLSYMSDMCLHCDVDANMLSNMFFLLYGACKIAKKVSLHPDEGALYHMSYFCNAL